MPVYVCRLLHLDGKTELKILKDREFERVLSKDDVVVLSSFAVPNFFSWMYEKVSSAVYKLRLRGVKLSELIDFCKSMSVMLRAGVPLTVALEDYIEITTNTTLRKALSEVLEEVKSGESLSNALEKREFVFPRVMVRVIRIGEETGNLEKAFRDVAVHFIRIDTLKSNIKRALMYPSFVVLATFGALAFWLVYVLPKIASLFKNMDIKLPRITIFVMTMSEFFQKYFLHMIAAFVFLVVVLWVLKKRSERVAYLLDYIFIKLPILGLILNNFFLAFVAEYMRLLIMAGSTIDRCLELVAESVGNLVYRKAILRIRERVIMGESLSGAFSKEKVFPRFFVRMIKSGEESGLMDEQLQFAAEAYYEKLDDISQKIGKMLEPIVLAFVGGLFALIMISLLMPIYDLVSKLGRW